MSIHAADQRHTAPRRVICTWLFVLQLNGMPLLACPAEVRVISQTTACRHVYLSEVRSARCRLRCYRRMITPTIASCNRVCHSILSWMQPVSQILWPEEWRWALCLHSCKEWGVWQPLTLISLPCWTSPWSLSVLIYDYSCRRKFD